MTDIIIINYNSSKYLRKCLESLSISGVSKKNIWIIDNNSDDKTSDDMTIWSEYSEHNIYNMKNVGFTAACNQGISLTKAKYVLLLNPDTEVIGAAVQVLEDYMEKNLDVAIAGAKLLYPDGGIQYSCRKFPNFVTFMLRALKVGNNSKIMRSHLMMDYDHNTVRNVDWVLGSCMMIRRGALENVGLLNERYFLYYSDIEYCWRAKRFGWKVAYVPNAIVKHYYQRVSSNIGMRNSLMWSHLRSAIRFFVSTYFDS